MPVTVKVNATAGSGNTLSQLADAIGKRISWMNDTARDSVAATMITALKSIRSSTKVAKAKGRIDVCKDNTLFPSYSISGGIRRPCVRISKNGPRYQKRQNERIRFSNDFFQHKANAQAYRYKLPNSDKEHIIVACSKASAKIIAKEILKKAVSYYSGLARCAVSYLMMKTQTIAQHDDSGVHIRKVADRVTSRREAVKQTGEGGTYKLVLSDDLRYAVPAVRGGKSQIDVCLKKAVNKTVSIINFKCKKLVGFEKLQTPFPEVAKRRNK